MDDVVGRAQIVLEGVDKLSGPMKSSCDEQMKC